ncbi:3523_t:CDS:2 [Ambispora gerdemannii]|uniref:3523_t:CDS:1 n=1 Tax=Ambispora gerdemannii TaxID=144530 RepID=A0A9N9DRB2_9GLOM|nr:3523_t:CDS:2 [Ambispora gerdemannii]
MSIEATNEDTLPAGTAISIKEHEDEKNEDEIIEKLTKAIEEHNEHDDPSKKEDPSQKEIIERLRKAIEKHETSLVQKIIDVCLNDYKPYSMLIVVKVLPQLAVQYPYILSEFLEKCAYIKVPPKFKFRVSIFDTSYEKFFVSTSNKASYTDCYIPLPGLFNGPFEELVYLHSTETFQSPVFDAIVMRLRRAFFGWEIFVGFASSVLPVVIVSREFSNNLASPELQSLSVLFIWIFIALQLRVIESIGIFMAATDILTVALMNSAYEETYKNARAAWVMQVAEFMIDYTYLIPKGLWLESSDHPYIIYKAFTSKVVEQSKKNNVQTLDEMKDEITKEFRQILSAELKKFAEQLKATNHSR